MIFLSSSSLMKEQARSFDKLTGTFIGDIDSIIYFTFIQGNNSGPATGHIHVFSSPGIE